MATDDLPETKSPLVERYIVPLLVGAIVGILIYSFLTSLVWASVGFTAAGLFWYRYRGRHA